MLQATLGRVQWQGKKGRLIIRGNAYFMCVLLWLPMSCFCPWLIFFFIILLSCFIVLYVFHRLSVLLIFQKAVTIHLRPSIMYKWLKKKIIFSSRMKKTFSADKLTLQAPWVPCFRTLILSSVLFIWNIFLIPITENPIDKWVREASVYVQIKLLQPVKVNLTDCTEQCVQFQRLWTPK